MRVNEQIITCQNYSLTFKGGKKGIKSQNSHLLRNTIIAGTAGAGLGAITGYSMYNSVRSFYKNLSGTLNKKGILTDQDEEKFLSRFNSKYKTTKTLALSWGIYAITGYLGYRGIKHLIKR